MILNINKRRERGSIIVSTVILVTALSLLGLTLQQFLRQQIRTQYGLQGDGTAYNMPVDDAYAEAQYMAEWCMNWAMWAANHTNQAPGVAPPLYPVPLPTTLPTNHATETANSGYAEPGRNKNPIPPSANVAIPDTFDYHKRCKLSSPSLQKLVAEGQAIIRGDSTTATRLVKRTLYADWDRMGGLVPGTLYYLKKSTWAEDQ